MSFRLTRKSASCPVCGENNTRCRVDDSTGIVLCGNNIEGFPIPGLRFLGSVEGGGLQWGQFIESENCPICGRNDGGCFEDEAVAYCGNELDDLNLPGFDYRGRTRKGDRGVFAFAGYTPTPRPQAPKIQLNFATPEQWDCYYQSLAGNLQPGHEADIRNRLRSAGLNPEQHLPALNAYSLETGYVVPIPSLQGLLLGGQLKANPALVETMGKYVWSPFKGEIHEGQPHPQWPFDPSIANDRRILFEEEEPEYPIAFWHPQQPANHPHTLALVEGTGVKPYIAAQVLGMPTVGAASGHHAGALVQIRQIVQALGITELMVVPDAGDLINGHVLHRVQSQIDLAAKLGLPCTFLWWGQATKDWNDIDEGVSGTPRRIPSGEYLPMMEAALLAQEEEEEEQEGKGQEQGQKLQGEPSMTTTKSIKAEKVKLTPEEEDELMRERILEIMACEDPIRNARMTRDFQEKHRIGATQFQHLLLQAIQAQVQMESVEGAMVDLFEMDIPPISYALPGLLAENEGMMIYGESGIGKSNLCIAMARSLITGEDFLGIPASRRYRVGFVGSDQSFGSLLQSLTASGLKETICSDDYRGTAAEMGKPWLCYQDKVSILNLGAFESFLNKYKPEFVFLDSTNTFIQGAPSHMGMNGDAFSSALANWVTVAGRHGCGLIVLHHSNKTKLQDGDSDLLQISGNSKIPGPFMSILSLRSAMGDETNKKRVLKQVKHRGGQCIPSLYLEYNPTFRWYGEGVFNVINSDVIANFYKLQRQIIGCYKGLPEGTGLEFREIADHQIGYSTSDEKSDIYKMVDSLVANRVLELRFSKTSGEMVAVLINVPPYLASALEDSPPPPPPATALTDNSGTPIAVGDRVLVQTDAPDWEPYRHTLFNVAGVDLVSGHVIFAEFNGYRCPAAIVRVATEVPAPPPPGAAQPECECPLQPGDQVRWVIPGNPVEGEIILRERAAMGIKHGSIGVVTAYELYENGVIWLEVDVSTDPSNPQLLAAPLSELVKIGNPITNHAHSPSH